MLYIAHSSPGKVAPSMPWIEGQRDWTFLKKNLWSVREIESQNIQAIEACYVDAFLFEGLATQISEI